MNMHKPVSKSNSKNLKEVCSAIIEIPMLRYRAIAEYYTEEPLQINIELERESERQTFEQILRIRKWLPNDKIISWTVYCDTREDIEENSFGVILRWSVWDKYMDMCKVRNSHKTDRSKLIKCWPQVSSENLFIRKDECNLFRDIENIDLILEKGIKLEDREGSLDDIEWSDLEIMRLFDWGTVHGIWSKCKIYSSLEALLQQVVDRFEEYRNKKQEEIWQMELDYTYPLAQYKNIVCGEQQIE